MNPEGRHLEEADLADVVRRKIMGYIVARAIAAVCEVGIPDALAAAPRRIEDLAFTASVDCSALYRYLQVLGDEGLTVRDHQGFYRLTEAGRLLCDGERGSLSHLVQLMGFEAYEVWGEGAIRSLKSGRESFSAFFGKPYFDWLADYPEAALRFDRGQANLVEQRLLPIFEYDWLGASTVVDVGGGTGSLLVSLLERYAHLHGTLVELPHVAKGARRTLTDNFDVDRWEVVAGDFRSLPIPNGDVIMLSQILHDWPDTDAQALLSACRSALEPNGSVIIVEQVLGDDSGSRAARLLDLHMLVLLGGRERSKDDWARLLKGAGLRIAEICVGPRSSAIVCRPI